MVYNVCRFLHYVNAMQTLICIDSYINSYDLSNLYSNPEDSSSFMFGLFV